MATTSTVRPRALLGHSPQRRPDLVVLPRRRRLAGFVVTVVVALIAGMMAVTVFHTRLAERQFELDLLERSVLTERSRFDVLRRDRAWMASPERLAERARALGLVPGGRTEFLDVPTDVLVSVMASTAGLDPTVSRPSRTPLDDFSTVKRVLKVQP